MKKCYLHLLGLFLVLFSFLMVSTSSNAFAAVDATHPGFRVEGRFLYDNQDEKTILYGINKMVVWQDKDGDPSFSEIAKTGANCVRIVWTMKDGTAAELDTAIANCRAEHMIPIVELHDATGEFDKLQSLVDWWTSPETVQVIQKHQDYLLINIGNELGNGNVSDSTFRDGYTKAVTRIRAAGIHVPLMIDGSSWGQDINKLQACGPDILAADPDSNCMFSAHLWWPYMYGHTAQEVIDELTESANMNLPLVVGEFANQWDETAQGQIPYKTIMEYCAKYQIGYLIWSWGPGNSPQTFLDMTTDGNYDTMQDWAKEMVYDDPYAMSKLAVRPASMLSGMPALMPDAPLKAGNLAQGKAVIYSSKESDAYAGENITDGDLNTRWASSSNSSVDWAYIDLGSSKDINEVLIKWENAYATQYQIQVSDDAKTWTDVYKTFSGKGGSDDVKVSGTGRYVRIYCTQKFNSQWGYSIFEVGVYGPESELAASVAPTTAIFDKNVDEQEDLVFALDSKANTLTAVKNNGAILKEGTDYTVSEGKLTIAKEYLAALEKGTIQLTLVYDNDSNPVINIAIGNTAPLPYVRPAVVEFNKKAGAGKDAVITLSSTCGTLTGITNGTKALVEGTDYTVDGKTVTISKEYLSTLAIGSAKLTFNFAGSDNLDVALNVTDTSESSIITPVTAGFEKTAPEDIKVSMILNGNELKSILNGEDELAIGTDYTVSDDTVVISKEYLTKLSLGETKLTFVFSAGKDSVLAVNVTNTVPSSAIEPASAVYDISAPAAIDVAITFNGNTLDKIMNGDYVLVEGQDYTVNESGITLSEDYLASLKNGTSKLTFVFSGGDNQILAIKVMDTSKIPATTDMKVLMNNSNSNETTNSLCPRFNIVNTGSDAIDVSNLTLRYYFTADGPQDECFWCDWSSLGNSNVKGKFVKMDEPTDTADTYLEISFTEGAGSIAPNTTAFVQTRFAKLDWTNFNQANDYSYNPNGSNYETNDKITVYYNDSLIAGMEP